jgi:hypothetical protein
MAPKIVGIVLNALLAAIVGIFIPSHSSQQAAPDITINGRLGGKGNVDNNDVGNNVLSGIKESDFKGNSFDRNENSRVTKGSTNVLESGAINNGHVGDEVNNNYWTVIPNVNVNQTVNQVFSPTYNNIQNSAYTYTYNQVF